MTSSLAFTVHRSPFTIRYPFTFIRDQWLMANGKYMVKGKRLMANGFTGGKAC